MSTTTPSLESIDFALLAAVSGGCHKPQTTQIVNVQAPPPAAQVAPPPAPMPGPQVQTSVSINSQPAG